MPASTIQRNNSVLAVLMVSGLLQISNVAGASERPLARLMERFVSEEGYSPRDGYGLMETIETGLVPADPEQLFPSTARVEPLPMGVLALEATEGVQDRVRYRVTYSVVWAEEPPRAIRIPFSFIQVDRFDLEGEGSHTSWRLVTRPLMGHAAVIEAAGRAQLSRNEAERALCLQASCLSPHSIVETAAPWNAMEEIDIDLDAPFPVERAASITPAAAVSILTDDFGIEDEGRGGEPGIPAPFLEIVIEVDLEPGAALNAAMRWGGLMDDSVAVIWRRVTAASQAKGAPASVAGTETYECRRGQQFPPPGRFCP